MQLSSVEPYIFLKTPKCPNPMYTSALIRFGELSLKGKNRDEFESSLQQQMILSCKKEGLVLYSKN